MTQKCREEMFFKEVTLKQNLKEVRGGANYANIWGKNIPGRGQNNIVASLQAQWPDPLKLLKENKKSVIFFI